MKSLFTPAYTFNAAARTLDLSAISGFSIRRLVAVINITRGAIIYAPGITGYTNLAGSVLTLAYDTTGHANSDDLMIFYDDGTVTAVASGNFNNASVNTTGTAPTGQAT